MQHADDLMPCTQPTTALLVNDPLIPCSAFVSKILSIFDHSGGKYSAVAKPQHMGRPGKAVTTKKQHRFSRGTISKASLSVVCNGQYCEDQDTFIIMRRTHFMLQ